MRPTIIDTAKRCSIDGHADEGIFCTQHQLSLLDKKQTPFLSLARLVKMTYAHPQADIVYHIEQNDYGQRNGVQRYEKDK